jgi:rare lipoprotein A
MILKSVFAFVFISVLKLINPSNEDRIISGKASYYAHKFEGRRTSSGQKYRASERTAAHRTYPFGTLLEVTNPRSGAKTLVRVNDRGPHTKSRLLDLSYSAAKDLGLVSSGVAEVSIKVVSLGSGIVIKDEEIKNQFVLDSTSNTSVSLPILSDSKER